MSIQTVKVPDIGGDEVEVIEICVSVGDQVAEEDSIVVLESDKASMEIPSPAAGVVKSIVIAVGDNVSEGSIILELESEAEAVVEAVVETIFENVSEAAPKAEPVAAPPTVAAESAAVASRVETINVPDFGGGEAEVIEVCIAAGDDITEGDSLIVLETDKASMEVPSPKSGKVVSITIAEGSQASEGAAILELEVAGSAPAVAAVAAAPATQPAASVAAPAAATPPVAPVQAQRVSGKDFVGDTLYAGPAVRKIMREFGVDGLQIKGSGPKGRILKEDVQKFVKEAI
ncbi:MAG: pyruvate dehydrogenase E2 component (dihydrolipoamide acetyltransferase), partial [Pseudohongiellaceae bacterium]